MNKNLLLGILILLVVLIVGGFFLIKKPEKNPEVKKTEMIQEETPAGKTQEREGNQGFFEKNVSMVCKYKVEGSLEFTSYIKGTLIKTVVEVPGDTNYSLFRDNKVYQWSEKQKRGFFMNIEDAKKQPGTEIKDPGKYVDEIMTKYKPDCKKTDIPDSVFVIPQDVQFEDMSKLLQR